MRILFEKRQLFLEIYLIIFRQILSKWIINLKNNFWFEALILMFQKEVASRIIANFNSSDYGRLSILANWLNIKNKRYKTQFFLPKPKIDSTCFFKENFYKINNSKNLEKSTRIFNNRRKMVKNLQPNFNGDQKVSDKLNLNLNLRPQNLSFETYYKLTQEYEKLTS